MTKKVTIEDLAVMVKKGFDHVDQRFDEVDERFDRIEKLILEDHKRRIEKLEIGLREVKDLFAMK